MELLNPCRRLVLRSGHPANMMPLRPSTPIKAAIITLLLSVNVRGITDDSRHTIIGLPPSRYYAFEEAGNVSRGARLGFDALGRLAIIDAGAYVVLNDSTWTNRLEKKRGDDTPTQIAPALSSRPAYYYGGAGSWGVLETQPDGKLRPRSLRPVNCPTWTLGTNFIQVLPVPDGVYFGGANGIVFWDAREHACRFFETNNTAIFSAGDRIYVFSRSEGLKTLGPDGLSPIYPAGVRFASGEAIERTTALDRQRIVLSTTYKRLLLFDGKNLVPWAAELDGVLTERIMAVEYLGDGDVAVAIRKKGLFILSAAGELLRSLTGPEYESINDIAAHEPGILWISTNAGVEKIYYRSPASLIDERIGVEGDWPAVLAWNGKAVIIAGGRLFESMTVAYGATAKFRRVPGLESTRVQAAAAQGPHLLIGNTQGVFAVEQDSKPMQVVADMDVIRMSMLAPDLCLAIGGEKIAALRLRNGNWEEFTGRIPGYGFPYLAHSTRSAVWVEYGANRVARLSLRDGALHAQLIETFPWKEPRWVNVGVIGDMVTLTSPESGRLFFDEKKESFCDAPEIRQLLQQSPYWLSRVVQDDAGVIWGTHEQGVVRFIKSENGYTCDVTTLDTIRDRDLLIQIVNGNDVWLSSARVLHHVGGNLPKTKPAQMRPVLASIHDARTGLQIFDGEAPQPLSRLPYIQNSLSFRFFAGSHALKNPTYEFRMNEQSGSWSILGADSLLSLPNLREGYYKLEVRVSDSRGPVGPSLDLQFEIAPPWYRTWQARSGCAALGLGMIFGFVAWLVSRTRRRNKALENLVGERTEALRQAMEQLNEETRNAATLAERGRLANEIHDSVQQGLSGLILQLDSTLKLPSLAADIRARIDVTRRMVAHTREELRHALWDMESPLLQDTELGDALMRVGAAVGSGDTHVDVRVEGTPVTLPQSTKHHLLRIAQEAVTNAVRHSEAKHIRVELVHAAGHVSISVNDNGIGFEQHTVVQNGVGHFGLRSIRTRASKIGADLKIRSERNHGTSITIILPTAQTPGAPSDAPSNQG